MGQFWNQSFAFISESLQRNFYPTQPASTALFNVSNPAWLQQIISIFIDTEVLCEHDQKFFVLYNLTPLVLQEAAD